MTTKTGNVVTKHADAIEVDYEDLYEGGSLFPEGNPLREVIKDVVPWDIGGPQPALVELEAGGGVCGRVLDVGCGLGDTALFLAGRGYAVTAFDNSPAAIRRARARADALDLPVEFLVADATTLDGLTEHTFDTILDNGLYHGLGSDQRRPYLAALHRIGAPGARSYFACFSDETLQEIRPPRKFSAEDVRKNLAETGWAIVQFATISFVLNPALTRNILRQAVTVANPNGNQKQVDELNNDEHGRLLLPAWLITADRAEAQS
jgi:SAM-dependent methyltransferase